MKTVTELREACDVAQRAHDNSPANGTATLRRWRAAQRRLIAAKTEIAIIESRIAACESAKTLVVAEIARRAAAKAGI